MRYGIWFILVALTSCKKSNNQLDFSIGSSQNASLQIETNNTSNFSNQDQSYVKVDATKTQIVNVTFSEISLNRDNEFDHYIIKQIQETITLRGQEGQDSKINIYIFSPKSNKLIKTISKKFDRTSFSAKYLHSTKYGCCGSEDYNELSSIWTDDVFLRFNSKYYQIEIPNSHTNFYLGYVSDTRDEEKLILGELYLAHELPYFQQGKSSNFSNFKIVNKLIFKAKTLEVFNNLLPFTPSITLVKNSSKDQLIDFEDHQELRLWSFNNAKSLEGVDFLGLKIKFESDVNKSISQEIPIKNGLLFGDNSIEKEVEVDK
jgi:hypothetical protein